MKNIFVVCLTCIVSCIAHLSANAAPVDGTEYQTLESAIQNVQNACNGISDDFNKLKRNAGINTAVSGTGTLAGAAAVTAGMSKDKIDTAIGKNKKELAEHKKQLSSFANFFSSYQNYIDNPNYENEHNLRMIWDGLNDDTKKELDFDIDSAIAEGKELHNNLSDEDMAKYKTLLEIISNELNKETPSVVRRVEFIERQEKASHTAGNMRTGTLAAATATNVAGAVLSTNTRADTDIKSRIDTCNAAVNKLANLYPVARQDPNTDQATISRADTIISACTDLSHIDLTKINSKSKTTTVTNGIGATLGLVGLITSAAANNKNNDSDNNHTMDKASNILAGGTTAASGIASVFSATQISAINHAADVAKKCEDALQ